MNKEELNNRLQNKVLRKCNSCNELLPVTEFFIKKYISKKGEQFRFNSPCKICSNVNRNRDYQRQYHRKIKFNITQQEYDILLQKQNYCCAICGIHYQDCSRQLAVDHDHATLKIRGLLCNQCNTGLGLLQDNTHILKKAILYLKK